MMLAATLGHHVSLDDEAYYLLNEYLEQHFGLVFDADRRLVLENRLQPRLRAHCLPGFLDYYFLLCGPEGPRELPELATAVTNNETYFFREPDQIGALFGPGQALLDSSGRRSQLRVLSAGCSSGEEAYTLSFWARDVAAQGSAPPLLVDGIDLDPVRVAMARAAEYRPRSLRTMEPPQVARYLRVIGPERYQVPERLREGVRFYEGNLVEPRTLTPRGTYDAVFCRNVLIYFSEPALRRAVQNLLGVLRPGGLLFLGSAESVIGMFPQLKAVRLGNVIAYQRVG